MDSATTDSTTTGPTTTDPTTTGSATTDSTAIEPTATGSATATTTDPTAAVGPTEGRPSAAAVGPATFATGDRRRLRNLIDGLNAAFVDTS